MELVNRVLGIALAAGMSLGALSSAVHAESAVPDPGAFFAGTPEFDPQAGGTKYPGTLTVSYVFSENLSCPGLTIENMYVVLTLAQGNNTKAFNANFAATGTDPFCFDDTPLQIQYVLDVVRQQALPHFYNQCIPGSTCPQFKVKSVTNFQSSGTGAVSTNITIAVQ